MLQRFDGALVAPHHRGGLGHRESLEEPQHNAVTLVVAELGREFAIDPRHAATVLAGTYDEALREAVTEGHEIDAELLHATLPMLLLAATRPLDVSAGA